MIEVKAQKGTSHLNNFAAYLVRFNENKIVTKDVVEALPEYSDMFWNKL